MSEKLLNDYRKLIKKHYAAVQTDTIFEYTDSFSLEKKARAFWADFNNLEEQFLEDLKNVGS